MKLSTINHRICLVKYVRPTLQLCSLNKTPLCFKNGVFRKSDKLGSKPARFVDKWFRQDLSENGKAPCERKLHHKKNNQHVYWVAFIFDFCWETHVFLQPCLTGATSTLKFPIAQIATNLPCESERLQQVVGLDRLVYGLRFFFTIKRPWILHSGGVLSHGVPPNHPCDFRIVHYKLSMGTPIYGKPHIYRQSPGQAPKKWNLQWIADGHQSMSRLQDLQI